MSVVINGNGAYECGFERPRWHDEVGSERHHYCQQAFEDENPVINNHKMRPQLSVNW